MKPNRILLGSALFWPAQGLANAQHQDVGPGAVAHADVSAVDPTPSEISPLRPRKDLDPNVAAKAAIDAMNSQFYSSSQAIWSPSDPWWLSGVALIGVIDFMRKTKSTIYVEQVKNIVQVQRGYWNGDFRAESTDDTGWWALAMIRMYDLTGDSTYLNISIEDEAYMYEYWTASPCGGGMYVDIQAKTYKNAIANELYIKLAASLHNRIANDTTYLSRAETAWSWFQVSGMINSDGLINDGLASNDNSACFNNKLPVWTYNQGVILGALVELYHATASQAHLTTAVDLANKVTAPSSQLTTDKGILTESGCSTPDAQREHGGCNHDQQVFKGVFAANLAELDAAIPDGSHPYRDYLRQNAQSAYDHARQAVEGGDLYDVGWAGPFWNSTIAKQASAVGLLVAVI